MKIGVFPSPFFFSTYAYIEARQSSAEIIIGDGTWINNNFSVISDSSFIRIGNRCFLGANVEIIDSDFHALNPEDRARNGSYDSRPVEIGSNVFIGSNVKILKGVTIGDGSVIANGSIVTKDVPKRAIAGGNPARVIRLID